jgi:hypothetical protein
MPAGGHLGARPLDTMPFPRRESIRRARLNPKTLNSIAATPKTKSRTNTPTDM